MRDPPSGRVPEQGPDWFLVATMARGGGTPDLGYFLEIWGFIGEVGVKKQSSRPRGRGARLHPRGLLVAPLTDFFRLYIYINIP